MRVIPRRVLLTTDTVTGVWEATLELARGLSARDIEVHLVASGGLPADKQRHDAQVIHGLTFYPAMLRLEWMDHPWADVDVHVRRVEDIAWTVRPHIIHANELTLPGMGSFGVPVVVTAHGDRHSHAAALGHDPSAVDADYTDRVKAGLANAASVTAPTHWLLDRLAETYGPFTTAGPIPHGRNPELFEPATERAPVILAAGRLWDEAKNMAALDAAADGLPWPVEVAGARIHPDGHRAGEFTHLKRLGVLAQDELRARLNRAAILVHPARYEPFGLPPQEAALGGCALVLADIPPLRELWPEDTARWFDPNDADALHRTLNELIEDADGRRALAERARNHALTRSRERMVEATLALYDRVLSPDG